MKRSVSTGTLILTLLLLIGLRLLGGSDPFAGAIQNALTIFSENPSTNSETATDPGMDSLEAENARLRQQLNLQPNEGFTTLGASVVNRSSGTYRSSIRINRGSQDGLKQDMAVLSNGFLIGIIHEVFIGQSSVILIDDPSFRASVTIEGTGEIGIITNTSGGTVLDKISNSAIVETDSLVATNGRGGLFYPGLPVGRIGDDLTSNDDVLKSFILKTHFANRDLREVFVVLDYEQ